MWHFLKSEQGRSMVEMLGVLALIGILSLTAIAGYSYAVTKWKANDTLEEVSLRAMEYTRQIAMNKALKGGDAFDNFDLGNETRLGYGITGHLKADNRYFEVEVSGVEEKVCRQIIRDKANPILGISLGESEEEAEEEACTEGVLMAFLYSRTLEGSGSDLGGGEGDDSEEEVSCSEDEFSSNGHCCPINTSGWASEESQCCAFGEEESKGHCCAFGKVWKNGSCQKQTCASNADCDENEYCWLDSETNDYACTEAPTQGECRPVSGQKKVVDGVSYIKSNSWMSWWSLANFCERVKGQRISLSDFGCDMASGPCHSGTIPMLLRNFGNFWIGRNDSNNICDFTNITIAFDEEAYSINVGGIDSIRGVCRLSN